MSLVFKITLSILIAISICPALIHAVQNHENPETELPRQLKHAKAFRGKTSASNPKMNFGHPHKEVAALEKELSEARTTLLETWYGFDLHFIAVHEKKPQHMEKHDFLGYDGSIYKMITIGQKTQTPEGLVRSMTAANDLQEGRDYVDKDHYSLMHMTVKTNTVGKPATLKEATEAKSRHIPGWSPNVYEMGKFRIRLGYVDPKALSKAKEKMNREALLLAHFGAQADSPVGGYIRFARWNDGSKNSLLKTVLENPTHESLPKGIGVALVMLKPEVVCKELRTLALKVLFRWAAFLKDENKRHGNLMRTFNDNVNKAHKLLLDAIQESSKAMDIASKVHHDIESAKRSKVARVLKNKVEMHDLEKKILAGLAIFEWANELEGAFKLKKQYGRDRFKPSPQHLKTDYQHVKYTPDNFGIVFTLEDFKPFVFGDQSMREKSQQSDDVTRRENLQRLSDKSYQKLQSITSAAEEYSTGNYERITKNRLQKFNANKVALTSSKMQQVEQFTFIVGDPNDLKVVKLGIHVALEDVEKQQYSVFIVNVDKADDKHDMKSKVSGVSISAGTKSSSRLVAGRIYFLDVASILGPNLPSDRKYNLVFFVPPDIRPFLELNNLLEFFNDQQRQLIDLDQALDQGTTVKSLASIEPLERLLFSSQSQKSFAVHHGNDHKHNLLGVSEIISSMEAYFSSVKFDLVNYFPPFYKRDSNGGKKTPLAEETLSKVFSEYVSLLGYDQLQDVSYPSSCFGKEDSQIFGQFNARYMVVPLPDKYTPTVTVTFPGIDIKNQYWSQGLDAISYGNAKPDANLHLLKDKPPAAKDFEAQFTETKNILGPWTETSKNFATHLLPKAFDYKKDEHTITLELTGVPKHPARQQLKLSHELNPNQPEIHHPKAQLMSPAESLRSLNHRVKQEQLKKYTEHNEEYDQAERLCAFKFDFTQLKKQKKYQSFPSSGTLSVKDDLNFDEEKDTGMFSIAEKSFTSIANREQKGPLHFGIFTSKASNTILANGNPIVRRKPVFYPVPIYFRACFIPEWIKRDIYGVKSNGKPANPNWLDKIRSNTPYVICVEVGTVLKGSQPSFGIAHELDKVKPMVENFPEHLQGVMYSLPFTLKGGTEVLKNPEVKWVRPQWLPKDEHNDNTHLPVTFQRVGDQGNDITFELVSPQGHPTPLGSKKFGRGKNVKGLYSVEINHRNHFKFTISHLQECVFVGLNEKQDLSKIKL